MLMPAPVMFLYQAINTRIRWFRDLNTSQGTSVSPGDIAKGSGVMQSMQQPGQIECDSQLGAVFQAKQVKLSSLSQRISPHLRPVDPLSLRYTVRLDSSAFPTPGGCDLYASL